MVRMTSAGTPISTHVRCQSTSLTAKARTHPASALAHPLALASVIFQRVGQNLRRDAAPPGTFVPSVARLHLALSLASAHSVIAPHCCTAEFLEYCRITPSTAPGVSPSDDAGIRLDATRRRLRRREHVQKRQTTRGERGVSRGDGARDGADAAFHHDLHARRGRRREHLRQRLGRVGVLGDSIRRERLERALHGPRPGARRGDVRGRVAQTPNVAPSRVVLDVSRAWRRRRCDACDRRRRTRRVPRSPRRRCARGWRTRRRFPRRKTSPLNAPPRRGTEIDRRGRRARRPYPASSPRHSSRDAPRSRRAARRGGWTWHPRDRRESIAKFEEFPVKRDGAELHENLTNEPAKTLADQAILHVRVVHGEREHAPDEFTSARASEPPVSTTRTSSIADLSGSKNSAASTACCASEPPTPRTSKTRAPPQPSRPECGACARRPPPWRG